MKTEPTAGKPTGKSEFEQAGQGRQATLVGEFIHFMAENKKWWLLPILLVLMAVGIFAGLVLTGAAPFIYTLF